MAPTLQLAEVGEHHLLYQGRPPGAALWLFACSPGAVFLRFKGSIPPSGKMGRTHALVRRNALPGMAPARLCTSLEDECPSTLAATVQSRDRAGEARGL